jgi:hypothetical protein
MQSEQLGVRQHFERVMPSRAKQVQPSANATLGG